MSISRPNTMFDTANFNPLSLALLFFSKDSIFIVPLLIIYQLFSNWPTVNSYIKTLKLRNKTRYEFSDKIYVNKTRGYTYGNLTKQVNSIFYYIKQLIDTKQLQITKAINIPLTEADFIGAENMAVLPTSDCTIKLNDDIDAIIDISFHNTKVNDEDRFATSVEEIHIVITLSTHKQLNTITSFINKLMEDFAVYEHQQKYKDINIIKPEFEGDEIALARKIPFKSTKTFDNLFFDGKEELLKRLDSFKKRDNYKLLGMPESLGILLYGEPGTGKTSTIKAVANYMKMNLIIVPMSKIKTKSQLEALFYEKSLNSVPYDNRIYVFEEVDCNGWEDIVRDRRLIKDDASETPSENNDESVIELIANKINSVNGTNSGSNSITKSLKNQLKKEPVDELTLGSFLEIIDGLVEIPGRIVIMTTNHREILDPALTRPGRIDIELEFKKLRKPHIASIYKKWYGHNIPAQILNKVPDYRYTQADISQLLFKYETDSDAFCDYICKED